MLKKLRLGKFVLFFLFLLSLGSARAQNDSCTLQISLLTCAPGEELYSTFGHTAIRVRDASNGSDYVFNYGTFEFGPDFYGKFIRGKLRYFLSVENFNDFQYTYQLESRSIQEQILLLSCAEKQALLQALFRNAQETNRYYRYDFLFDNCTTRARDMIVKQSRQPVVFANILPPQAPTFRNLIHSYLNAGHEYWSKLGIDLLLGAKLDRQVSNAESMFLPEYLLKGVETAQVNGRLLAAPPQTLLDLPSPLDQASLLTPGVVFGFLLVVVLALSFLRKRRVQQALHVFDRVFFFLLGIVGVLLLFMWFGTDHTVCANNYNLLWALPAHLACGIFAGSGKAWVRTYFRIVFFITALLLLTWAFLPQNLNEALIPLVLIVLLRSFLLSKTQAHATKRNQA